MDEAAGRQMTTTGMGPMLKIGEFSRIAQVSVKTLRYYDELGLLRPAWVDRYTGYRYYTLEQLTRLNRILAVRELGFSLVEVAKLLQDDLPVTELRRLLRLRQAELEHQVQEDQARLARVAARLSQIEQEGRRPPYEVLVKRAAARLVAGIRDTVADREEVAGLFQELDRHLKRHGVAIGATAPVLALSFDTEYADGGADIEAAVPIERPVRGNNRVLVHELPEVAAMASLVHQGSYELLPEAYRALAAWTQANGYRAGSPNREVYLEGFVLGPDRQMGVIEIQIPVERMTSPGRAEDEGGYRMEPRIVTKPAFTVVGLPFSGHISHAPFEGGSENNEIGDLWDRLSGRVPEIKNICGPGVGLCYGMPSESEPWYIAGHEVARAEDVPDDMMSMTVPMQRYAVFACTLGTLGETYRYITEEWQPATGHQHADVPDFEYYDGKFDPSEPQNMELSVYWPIK